MSKSIILTIIAPLALVAISQTKGDRCCINIAYSIIHACLGLPQEHELNLKFMTVECWIRNDHDACKKMCWSKFCADGYRILGMRYCGIGNCNVYGCNCDGGCRKNQGIEHKELQNAWLAQHGLIKKIIVGRKQEESNTKTFINALKNIIKHLKVVPSINPEAILTL